MNRKPNLFWIDKDPPRPGPFHYATMNSFYTSPAWRRLRRYKLSMFPLCERCLDRGLTVPAIDVHHIQEIDVRPELALDYNNLESLCKTCHSQETASNSTRLKKAQKGGIIDYRMKHINNCEG